MKNQKGFVKTLLVIIIVILAVLVGYFYEQRSPTVPATVPQAEQKTATTLKVAPTSNTTTYTNADLGISFDYPKAWGAVAKKVEKGCFFATSKEGCDNFTFTFSTNNKVAFSSASNSFVKDPNPRGGSYLDTMFIKSQADITNFCASRKGRTDTLSCELVTNKNGIVYAKALIKMCFEGDCEKDASLYRYMKLNSNTFSGMVFVSSAQDAQAVGVIDSIKFAK